MKERIYRRFSLIALSLAVLVLFGCAVTQPARFFILEPLAGADTATEVQGAAEGIAVGIGPVQLPEYLNRPQIVTRADENELRLDEFHRWVMPLKDNISRVLRENLQALLVADRVSIVSWKGPSHMDYQVKVDFVRFDLTSRGEASLVARWSVSDRRKKTRPISKTSTIHAPAVADGYNGRVSALNQTLAQFSREMAEAIKGLRK